MQGPRTHFRYLCDVFMPLKWDVLILCKTYLLLVYCVIFEFYLTCDQYLKSKICSSRLYIIRCLSDRVTEHNDVCLLSVLFIK